MHKGLLSAQQLPSTDPVCYARNTSAPAVDSLTTNTRSGEGLRAFRGARAKRACPLAPEIWAREKQALAGDVVSGAMTAQADFLPARIREAVKTFPAYATPRAVAWTTEPWTVELTLVTPTLKNKRLNIEARFAEEIEGLYARKRAA